jgi:hypothetical protein
VIAFGKVYILSGAILLATLPLLLFVRKTRPVERTEIHTE